MIKTWEQRMRSLSEGGYIVPLALTREAAMKDEINELRAKLAELEADALRYRWLTEDLDTAHGRVQRNEILRCMATMSYSAACTDIDHAMKGTPS